MQSPCHQERRRPTRRIADLKAEDRFRRLGRGRAILALFVAERFQRAMNRGHSQLGPGIERTRPLASVPGPNEIELAGGDDSLDELAGFGLNNSLVLGVGLFLLLLGQGL